MRKILIFFLLLILQCNIVKSQSQYWFGFGYNMSRFKMDNSLNYIIDRYNQTRTSTLTKEMKHIHFADGLAFSFGFNVNKFVFDLGYTGKKQTVFAQVNNSSGSGERYLRFKNRNFNMGFGFAFINTSNSSVALCDSLDIGKIKTETRLGDIPNIDKEEYEIVTDDLNMGSTFYLQFLIGFGRGKGLALIARPYYHISYFDTDFYAVNEKINSSTYVKDPDIIESKISNIGLSLILAIYGSN